MSFLVLGDWGCDIQSGKCDGKNQTNVANAMLSIHNKYLTSFVISVGDHFYENGILSSTDNRWETGFENIYHKSLQPWYVILGNHDHRGSVKAQIEYTKISERWILPSNYYIKDFKLSYESKMFFRLIFLDTASLLCYHDEYSILDELEKYECDESWFDPELDNQEFIERNEQLLWFENEVINADKNENIKFILIIGHHALWSQGPHKIPKIFNLHIQPIVRKSNKIIAWFCGHNHALEHYIWNKQINAKQKEQNKEYNVLHQFLSGSGGRDVHQMKEEPVETKVNDVKLGYIGKTYGFISVHIFNNYMQVKYWNQYSEFLYDVHVDYPDM